MANDDKAVENKKKKMLILTLGVGKKRAEGSPYDEAVYKFDNEGEAISAAFVAKPLVREFRPDMVFVIGTIKSSWLEFYQYFTTERNEEAELAFCELDPANGKDMSVQQLQKATKVINELFEKGMDSDPFSPGIKIRAIVTRYGMNDEELLENYQLISGIGNFLDKNTDYEIAFDITHSFRSLPIYNLIILNYLKVISESRLEIAHVYYGNFDAKYENDGISPIVDLQDLIHVMNLTSSVNEFKHTGNCRTLFTQIPESEQELREALEEFDWATQVNSFDKVQESLERLLRLTEREQPLASRYADLSRMIHTVLERKFLNRKQNLEAMERNPNEESPADPQSGGSLADKVKGLSLAEQRLMTSFWYLNQNRYGQAVATAYEALKSSLAPMYLTEVLKHRKAEEKDCLNEKYLRNAVERLSTIADRCRKKQEAEPLSEMETFFLELDENRNKAKQIRNRFAHNLREGEIGGSLKLEPEEEKVCIRKLIREVGELRGKIDRHYAEVVQVYAQKGGKAGTKPAAGTEERENIVVIAEKTAGVPYEAYRTSNKKTYNVFRFEDKVVRALEQNEDKVENALLVRKILQGQDLDYKRTRIYLYGLDETSIVQYTMILQEEGFREIERANDAVPLHQAVKKINARLDSAYYEEYKFKERFEVLQFTDLLEIDAE